MRISGQFGFVTILVMPIANTGAMRVEVILRSGVNKGESKNTDESIDYLSSQLEHLTGRSIVPEEFVSDYVRNIAIRADVACRGVMKDQLGSQNNWEERLQQIDALRRRFLDRK